MNKSTTTRARSELRPPNKSQWQRSRSDPRTVHTAAERLTGQISPRAAEPRPSRLHNVEKCGVEQRDRARCTSQQRRNLRPDSGRRLHFAELPAMIQRSRQQKSPAHCRGSLLYHGKNRKTSRKCAIFHGSHYAQYTIDLLSIIWYHKNNRKKRKAATACNSHRLIAK